jgi:uncharacterized protein YggT (Ycf19 family)
MATEHREHTEIVEGDGYARRRRVVEQKTDTRQVIVSRFAKFLWLVAALITGLITFRFLLKLIGANAATPFVDFVYSLTDVLVAPFNGIVTSPTFSNGGIVEIGALFAIIVYLLAFWAVVRLFRILFAASRSRRRVVTVERDS